MVKLYWRVQRRDKSQPFGLELVGLVATLMTLGQQVRPRKATAMKSLAVNATTLLAITQSVPRQKGCVLSQGTQFLAPRLTATKLEISAGERWSVNATDQSVQKIKPAPRLEASTSCLGCRC